MAKQTDDELKGAARKEALEAAAKIADRYRNAPPCQFHYENPCCHVRIGADIGNEIRALAK